ncbi:MAG: 4-hydroxythreonine-4-phosphate dehydrogenase PdxA [Rikenellaceae bacterium]|nr:4-hydroxythreonine-4-phosphate dehydrogenase PdxA [Rikenellaceae bacterium]
MGDSRIRVGITLGDVNGIGTEVVIKAFSDSRMCELCTPVIYGPSKSLAFYKKGIEGAESFQYTQVKDALEAKAKRVNVIDCGPENLVLEPGTATAASGAAAVEALKAAAEELEAGRIDVVVTAPINKENVREAGFEFTGHTEFFAARFGGQPLMMMCSDLMKVGLVTIHVPVSEIAEGVTAEKIVAALGRMRASLIADFGVVEPRLAVLSLNPHAGDGGVIGGEEKDIITPAILEARKKGILAFGPFAADGFFASGGYEKYDGVLAMYHDQGLAPFKALTPEGVNFTAGLPVVRTSPDHGVAYDIAGQDKADPESFRQAVYLAVDIQRSRKQYAEMTKNPLRRYEREKGADISVRDLIPESSED